MTDSHTSPSTHPYPGLTWAVDAARNYGETVGCETGVGKCFVSAHSNNFRWIPDGSIDLVLTDPPFNIAQDTNFHTWNKNTINSYRFDSGKGWDSHSREDFLQMLNVWAAGFARILRKGGSFAVFCADEYLSHLHQSLEDAGLNVRRTLTWRKPNAVPINRKTMMMSACEYVLLGVKGSHATFNANLPSDTPGEYSSIEQVLVADKAATLVEKKVREAVAGVSTLGAARGATVAEAATRAVRAAEAEIVAKVTAMYTENDDGPYLRGCIPNQVNFTSKGGRRLHPTEKPVPLLQYLVQLLSRPGDVVLDPFAGSASTGEAALIEGRLAVLVEADAEFFAAGTARLNNVESLMLEDEAAYRLFD